MTENDGDSDADAVDEQAEILRSLWEPHPGQQAIMDHAARFRLATCGRRWGKSEMAAHEALEYALEDADAMVWWIAPTYEQANSYGFDNVKPLLSRDIVADSPKLSKPREIELVNGSTLSFRSAEREDSLRGGGVDFLVIDEAGSVPDRAWVQELRPTLSDTEGDMLAIGTAKRQNWFYRWFQRGQDADYPDIASWQAPTIQNPHVADGEVESAQEDMPDREFRREYQAEFLEETGGVFTDLETRVLSEYDPEQVSPAADADYVHGVDLARSEDYTVIITLDEDARLVHFDRVRRAGWPEIQRRVEAAASRYPGAVHVDATRDNKIVSDLEDAGVSVTPKSFGGGEKQTLIQNLITAVEAGEVTLPDMDPLVHELEVFEAETTKTGNTRYRAPAGHKDDCVDALALAWDGYENGSLSTTIIRRSGTMPSQTSISPTSEGSRARRSRSEFGRRRPR
jgi:hypothetical protein